jgi:hypothetical protein
MSPKTQDVGRVDVICQLRLNAIINHACFPIKSVRRIITKMDLIVIVAVVQGDI